MSKTAYYCQCLLERGHFSGTMSTVSYLPEEFAIQGNVVKLKNDDDIWTDGWIVQKVGDKIDASYVEERERDYKRTRKTSDI